MYTDTRRILSKMLSEAELSQNKHTTLADKNSCSLIRMECTQPLYHLAKCTIMHSINARAFLNSISVECDACLHKTQIDDLTGSKQIFW